MEWVMHSFLKKKPLGRKEISRDNHLIFPVLFISLEATAATFWLCGSVKWQLILCVKVASLFNVTLNIRSKYRSEYSILRKESQFCFLAQRRGGEWNIIISWNWEHVLYLSYAFSKHSDVMGSFEPLCCLSYQQCKTVNVFLLHVSFEK